MDYQFNHAFSKFIYQYIQLSANLRPFDTKCMSLDLRERVAFVYDDCIVQF